MSERIKMTVQMDVTIPQALALKAMFQHWNLLAGWGCSRNIAFHVDGDGNFKPDCQVLFHGQVPVLTPELREAACVHDDEKTKDGKRGNGDRVYDFDPIAWRLSPDYRPPKKDDAPVVLAGGAVNMAERESDDADTAKQEPENNPPKNS